MIKVFFGLDWEAIRNPDLYFKYRWKEEWFEDDLVVKMVKDIDNTIVKSPNCLVSPVLGQIPPERLSGGVKALILLLKADMDIKIDLIACGDNCSKWVAEVGRLRDISVSMSGYDLFLSDEVVPLNAICENDGELIKNSEEWYSKAVKYVEDCECGVRDL